MTRPCPQCGAEAGSADSYCEECGHDLLVSRSDWDAQVRQREQQCSDCPRCGGSEISADGYCEQCGAKAPAGRDRVEFALGPVAGVSDRGRRGRTNEDAMALATVRQSGSWELTEFAVSVVCDGISSARRPEEASLAAVEAGIGATLASLRSSAEASDATRAGAAAAADAVRVLARPDDGNNPPSCTYVSAVVSADVVTVGWLGDSRAYWLGCDGPSVCLTSDDSWAAHMVAAGALDADKAFADDRAHTLVRWVGADADDMEPRVRTIRLPGPGVVLLCSDGLWNYLPGADELAARALPLATEDPLAAAKALTRFALDAGGHDNITVVVVAVPPIARSDTRSAP